MEDAHASKRVALTEDPIGKVAPSGTNFTLVGSSCVWRIMSPHHKNTLDQVLKWAQLLTFISALIGGGLHYFITFAGVRNTANSNSYKATRIERYLSTKDPQYWLIAEGLVKPGEPDIEKAVIPSSEAIPQVPGSAVAKMPHTVKPYQPTPEVEANAPAAKKPENYATDAKPKQ